MDFGPFSADPIKSTSLGAATTANLYHSAYFFAILLGFSGKESAAIIGGAG